MQIWVTIVLRALKLAPFGTAFGFFGLFSGIAILLASVLAGWLWQEFSPSLTFFSGALIAILSLFGFMLVGKERAVKN